MVLGFFDYICDYQLIKTSLEERRTRLFQIVSEHPDYDVFSMLLGIYSFVTEKYDVAKVYLEAGCYLNPYNTCWEILRSGIFFLMGENEQGAFLVKKLNESAKLNQLASSNYLINEFLHHVNQGDPLSAFKVGLKVGRTNERVAVSIDTNCPTTHPLCFISSRVRVVYSALKYCDSRVCKVI